MIHSQVRHWKTKRWAALTEYVSPTASSTDVTFNNFMMGLGKLVKKNTPLKRFGFSPFSCWFSSDLKMGVINKKRLHRIYKSSGLPELERLARSLPLDAIIVWSHMKNLRCTDVTPSMLKLGEIKASNPFGYLQLVYSPFFQCLLWALRKGTWPSFLWFQHVITTHFVFFRRSQKEVGCFRHS